MKGEKSQSNSSLSTEKRVNVSRPVVAKLIGFSFAMFILPIATYFLTLDGLFAGNNTYAAGSAALVANLVVVAYIIAAVMEDNQDAKTVKKE
ncbi:uncharacterized protein BYT42DRAFT_565395 [Radiomyces spectabilis]|uniref:uncharacterized protein n=1 Tax=Radiomyces spectabilis TaxID=64574 RepID=UPI00221F8F0D|nr:uncharacterized protein BYT42DRAFT_565395 [Radiomyces spectabilis]KAI8381135.1 hypothetical protein BYT42DRAFT_565395 [Radiomyces spectabilis]